MKLEAFIIFFSLFSFILAWTFISLQIKEFRIMGLSINDSVYSCLFFFLTGLHFFHLLVGLFLCCLYFWSCSCSILPLLLQIICKGLLFTIYFCLISCQCSWNFLSSIVLGCNRQAQEVRERRPGG